MEDKILELAAASPDARVRGVAMRLVAIEKEKIPLREFLSFYAGEAATMQVTLPVVTKVKVKSTINGATPPPDGKTRRMVDAACALLRITGTPLTLAVLFDRLSNEHPDLCPSKADSLRARLAEHRDAIHRIDKRGYWPVGEEAPTLNA